MNLAGDTGVFTFDSFHDSLVIWGESALEPHTNNLGYGLYFIAPSGGYTLVDIPAGATPSVIACDGRGRTYLSVAGKLHFFDGLPSDPVLTPLVDATGNVFDYGPLQPSRKLHYDARLTALVCTFNSHQDLALPPSVGIHVLPVTPDGDNYVSQGTSTVLPVSDHALGFAGMSRKSSGRYLLGTTEQGFPGEFRFHDVTIDPSTLVATVVNQACFGQAYYLPVGMTWYWPTQSTLVLSRVYETNGVLAGVFVPPPVCPGTGSGTILGCFPPDIFADGALETIPVY